MRVQGIKTPREPKDLDVTLPYGINFSITGIEGIDFHHKSDIDHYENEEFDRISFIMDGVEIDVFRPIENTWSQRVIETFGTEWSGWTKDCTTFDRPIKCVHWSEAMRQKMIYALTSHDSATKHCNDIPVIIEMNRFRAKGMGTSIDDLIKHLKKRTMNPYELRTNIENTENIVPFDITQMKEGMRVYLCCPSPNVNEGDSSTWFYEVFNVTKIPGYVVGTYADGSIFYMSDKPSISRLLMTHHEQ